MLLGHDGWIQLNDHDAEEERAQSSSDGDESGDLDIECGLGEKNFKRNAHTSAINKSLTKYVEIC
jgi:hypothetical protein